MYRRESGKEGKLGDTVELYKSEIDKLHDGAGIRLHVESEKSGQADVHLSTDDLKRIAADHLVRVQTYDPPAAEETASKLVDLATDRLVLLVENSRHNWGFEVRSFQEFMAARFITEGEDDVVLRRLKSLARSSHWRNTWLFAAANIFDNRTHLRERLVDKISKIDKESVADSLAKPGAQLACDLVADNFAAGAPGIRRRLLLQCVEPGEVSLRQISTMSGRNRSVDPSLAPPGGVRGASGATSIQRGSISGEHCGSAAPPAPAAVCRPFVFTTTHIEHPKELLLLLRNIDDDHCPPTSSVHADSETQPSLC